MRNNQKGFGLVEGILVLVILGLIGGTGWYVYDSMNNTNDSLDNASTVSNSPASKKTAIKKSAYPEGWKEYKSEKYNISFGYPADWTVKESDGELGENILVKSPDFKAEESEIGGNLTNKGAIIGFFISDTNKKTVDDFPLMGLEASVDKSYEANTKVAGVKAHEYEFTYEGDVPLYLRFVGKGHLYKVYFDGTPLEDERDSQLFDVYTKLKDTIKFI